MDAFITSNSSTLLSPSSSTDAISSTSLMMIAQQFFQQQQQIPTQDHTASWHWNEAAAICTTATAADHQEQEEEEEEDVAVYLDGFSPDHHQTNKTNDWIESLMMSSCISDPSESSHSASDFLPDDMLWSNVIPSSSSSDEQWPPKQQQGFEERQAQLIQLLASCLEDIDSGKYQSAKNKVGNLKALACAAGDSIQKCAFYFASGLENRLESTRNLEQQEQEEEDEDLAIAYKTLNDACPYLKFAHLTANQALLEATEGASKIHIVDYGTMQGVQWAAFLQAFATWPPWPNPSSRTTRRSLRITGIPSPHLGSNPAAAMLATKRRLTDFARILGIDFDFCPVLHPIQDFRPDEELFVDPEEVVAVNLILQLAQLPAAALKTAFSLVERLNPRIITVAEYEIHEQIASSTRFYSAVFDSMDVSMKRDDPLRIDAEKRLFGKEIWKSLLLGAKSKSELSASSSSSSSSPESQRRIISEAGLWSAPMSNYSISQARLLLWLYNKSDNFTLIQGPGSLSLGWLNTNIVTVSTWHC